MQNFLFSTLKSLKQTGTVAPSSKFLIKEIIQHVSFEKHQIFIEFGTGNGCITDAILKSMHPSSRLYSLEINADFYSYASKKYRGCTNVQVLNLNASSFDQILMGDKADYIISSLPLSILPNQVTDEIIQKVKKHLKPTGKYIQYQYSLNKFAYFKKQFQKVELDFTIRNLPPAFVYSCN